MSEHKSLMGPIWAVIIAGAVLLALVQLLPDSERAGRLVSLFIAIALIVSLFIGFKDYRKDKGKE
ncbi:MAG: hypothetical protein K6G79_00785 [Bacteroidales bacterium]|nr:hypothetical protein [Bacteroidales bacterium]